MDTRLYDELTPWYRLLDPPEDHAEEAGALADALARACDGPCETLLELGAGAGHNGLYLKERFACTLSDLSEPMLGLSAELNPECEHMPGDMRTLRLGRTFDAVLIHDAIVYMTTEADLRAALQSAHVHLRPGGAAVFAPDFVGDTVPDFSQLHQADEGDRSMRCLEWTWDPERNDNQYRVDFAFLLREGDRIRAVHDQSVAGVFPAATWTRLLQDVGFDASTLHRPAPDGYTEQIFCGRRR